MFASAGIDNLELRLPVTEWKANALLKACDWRTKEGVPVLIQDGIFLRFQPGKVFADLNVPKLAFGHNVRLAGPEQVRNAIRTLKTNTERAVPRLNWQRAEVSRLHVTFTREVQDFEACARLCKVPRGYSPHLYDNANGYHNANGRDLPVNWYDKREHLKEKRLQLPKDIKLEMEFPEHALYRFEARINQSPNSELKKHGGWKGLSILAEDFVQHATQNEAPGFASAMKYLQWQFERHVPIPNDRTPKSRHGMSAREYAALNIRETANENLSRMRQRVCDHHNAGSISRELLESELNRIAALERLCLARSLHAALENEVKQMRTNLVTVTGNLQTPEFEYAARTHRNTHAI